MKGRRQIPDVIKIANGTLRKCRVLKAAVNNSKIPRCPFAVSSIAGRKWKFIIAGLRRLGLIDEIDGTHVEAYCQNYQLAKDADKLIAKFGLLIPNDKGQMLKNPACTVSADAWNKVRAIGNDLGLNHLSRQRMTSTAAEKEDNIEAKYLG